ncbi:MAG TPA: M23 family metallopeptidase [Bacillota bacterium]|nr:M23 family metallopeptidase [Bacillota bacterium]
MNKKIKHVRKSIERRKKSRGFWSKEEPFKQINPVLPNDEEKHGYFPLVTGESTSKSSKSSLLAGYVVKGILSVLLFLAAAFILETEMPFFSTAKSWTSTALTREFPFARINKWYQETFGAPLGHQPEDSNDPDGLALPVDGTISESFQANGYGVMIAADEPTEVTALEDGVVTFAGNDRKTNKTVVIQHADNSTTTYGYLQSIDVHLYQSIQSNQRLGTFVSTQENSHLYFSIEKDNQYIDPVQVIQVDDRS